MQQPNIATQPTAYRGDFASQKQLQSSYKCFPFYVIDPL